MSLRRLNPFRASVSRENTPSVPQASSRSVTPSIVVNNSGNPSPNLGTSIGLPPNTPGVQIFSSTWDGPRVLNEQIQLYDDLDRKARMEFLLSTPKIKAESDPKKRLKMQLKRLEDLLAEGEIDVYEQEEAKRVALEQTKSVLSNTNSNGATSSLSVVVDETDAAALDDQHEVIVARMQSLNSPNAISSIKVELDPDSGSHDEPLSDDAGNIIAVMAPEEHVTSPTSKPAAPTIVNAAPTAEEAELFELLLVDDTPKSSTSTSKKPKPYAEDIAVIADEQIDENHRHEEIELKQAKELNFKKDNPLPRKSEENLVSNVPPFDNESQGLIEASKPLENSGYESESETIDGERTLPVALSDPNVAALAFVQSPSGSESRESSVEEDDAFLMLVGNKKPSLKKPFKPEQAKGDASLIPEPKSSGVAPETSAAQVVFFGGVSTEEALNPGLDEVEQMNLLMGNDSTRDKKPKKISKDKHVNGATAKIPVVANVQLTISSAPAETERDANALVHSEDEEMQLLAAIDDPPVKPKPKANNNKNKAKPKPLVLSKAPLPNQAHLFDEEGDMAQIGMLTSGRPLPTEVPPPGIFSRQQEVITNDNILLVDESDDENDEFDDSSPVKPVYESSRLVDGLGNAKLRAKLYPTDDLKQNKTLMPKQPVIGKNIGMQRQGSLRANLMHGIIAQMQKERKSCKEMIDSLKDLTKAGTISSDEFDLGQAIIIKTKPYTE